MAYKIYAAKQSKIINWKILRQKILSSLMPPKYLIGHLVC